MEHPYHDESLWNGASAQIFAKAKQLREKLTSAESALWYKLKGNQFLDPGPKGRKLIRVQLK